MVVFGWVGVGINTIGQMFWIHRFKSSKKLIPKRKNVTIIRVRIGLHIMVMNMMHIRGYYYPTDCFVQPFWQYNIGMIELREYH